MKRLDEAAGTNPKAGTGRAAEAFINAAFAYLRPSGAKRFNGSGRGTRHAGLTATATCVAEIAWHVERELACIDRFEARELVEPPACRHPDTAVSYPAGNVLADAARRHGVKGIVYTSVRDPAGTNLVTLFPHAVQSVAEGRRTRAAMGGQARAGGAQGERVTSVMPMPRCCR